MGLGTALSERLRRLFAEKPLGARGERAAARYLKRRGYKILAQGKRLLPGELDLVALERDTVVFVLGWLGGRHSSGRCTPSRSTL